MLQIGVARCSEAFLLTRQSALWLTHTRDSSSSNCRENFGFRTVLSLYSQVCLLREDSGLIECRLALCHCSYKCLRSYGFGAYVLRSSSLKQFGCTARPSKKGKRSLITTVNIAQSARRKTCQKT